METNAIHVVVGSLRCPQVECDDIQFDLCLRLHSTRKQILLSSRKQRQKSSRASVCRRGRKGVGSRRSTGEALCPACGTSSSPVASKVGSTVHIAALFRSSFVSEKPAIRAELRQSLLRRLLLPLLYIHCSRPDQVIRLGAIMQAGCLRLLS